MMTMTKSSITRALHQWRRLPPEHRQYDPQQPITLVVPPVPGDQQILRPTCRKLQNSVFLLTKRLRRCLPQDGLRLRPIVYMRLGNEMTKFLSVANAVVASPS